MFGVIFREYMLEQPGYLSIIRAYLHTLIIKIMRNFFKKSSSDIAVDKRASTVRSIIEHLKTNFSRNLSLDELALKTFYSKNYLCRLFKDITGTTLSEYVQTLRVEEACRLLLMGKKMSDIALEVGFSDYKSFYNTFKRVKGKAPSQFKHDLKKSNQ